MYLQALETIICLFGGDPDFGEALHGQAIEEATILGQCWKSLEGEVSLGISSLTLQ